jgi:N-acetyltransferase 10
MGYGTKSLDILFFFSKKNKKDLEILKQWDIKNLVNNKINKNKKNKKQTFPPILVPLENRIPPKLDYIGVSFSLSYSIFCFWKKNGFFIFIIRAFKNKISNEYTIIMIKPFLDSKKNFPNWCLSYQSEFLRSFSTFLSLDFGKISTILINNIIEGFKIYNNELNLEKIKKFFTPTDFRKIILFIKNEVFDYQIIIDIFPLIGRLILCGFFPKKFFSISEKIVLISIGLQFKAIPVIKKEFLFTTDNFSRIFTNIIKKIYKVLKKI